MGKVVRRSTILRVGYGRLVARLDRQAPWRADVIVVTGFAGFADAVCGLGSRCLRLLALRGGDAAFDGGGGAVGAGDGQRGGVTTNLDSCYYRQSWRGVSWLLTLREWHAVRVVSVCCIRRLSPLPDRGAEAVKRSYRAAAPPPSLSGTKACTGTHGNGVDSLSHARLARCRLNEGWPGGTACDVGLFLVL